MERQANRRDRRVWCMCTTCRLLEGGGRFLSHTSANYHAIRDAILQTTTFNIGGGVNTCIGEQGPVDQVCDIGSSSSNCPSQQETQNENLQLSELNVAIEADYDARRHTLESALLVKLIDIQKMWDNHEVSLELQGYMLSELFGGFNDSEMPVEKQTLGRLLSQLTENWDGHLEGVRAPTSWVKLVKTYSALGMIKPNRWKMCVGTEEFGHEPNVYPPSKEDIYTTSQIVRCQCDLPLNKKDCPRHAEICTDCNTMRKNMISFDYLPIGEQLALLMRSSTHCIDFLTMWNKKSRWMNKDVLQSPNEIKDFWDGEKVRIYQAFWDPTSMWELHVICPSCKMAHKSFPRVCDEKIWDETIQMYYFRCRQCREYITAPRIKCKGDPRNVALGIHWDGFFTSKHGSRSCWSVSANVLNAKKGGPLQNLPILFIPLHSHSDAIHARMNDAKCAFLLPLIEDLEHLFVEGFQVDFQVPNQYIGEHLPIMQDGPTTIRVILMLVIGDHPTQCRIGQLKSSGKSGCRRCVMHTSLTVQGQYYDHNLIQVHEPPPRRTSDKLFESVREWKRADTTVAKEKISRETGIFGESILWKLFHLYDFDLSNDLVFDLMHIAGLNLFKHYTAKLFNEVASLQDDLLLDEVRKVCAQVNKSHPYKLKQGRWPDDPIGRHSVYMAEENQKFLQWVLPHILHVLYGRIYEKRWFVGALLVDLAHYFFNQTRTSGWSIVNLEAVQLLLQAWRVCTEDLDGCNGAPLEHAAGATHLLDDVRRFGPSEIYWCFVFEREVARFGKITTNNKLMETSFIQYYSRKLFTGVVHQISEERDSLHVCQRALKKVNGYLMYPEGVDQDNHEGFHQCPLWHTRCGIYTSSIEKAKDITQTLKLASGSPCASMIAIKGILIGRKHAPTLAQSLEIVEYLARRFHKEEGWVPFINKVNNVMLEGVLYKASSHVVVKPDSGVDDTPFKAKIRGFFSHDFMGEISIYFSADYYTHLQDISYEGSKEIYVDLVDEVTGMNVVYNNRWCPFDFTCIRPVSSILHNFMLVEPGLSRRIAYEKSMSIAYELKDSRPRSRLLTQCQSILAAPTE